MAKILLILLIVIGLNSKGYSQNSQTREKFEAVISKNVVYQYLLYLPKEYGKDTSAQWPTMIFLHGSGERGAELDSVKIHGPPKLAEKKDFPFIIISPQCPQGEDWDADILNALLDDVIKKYLVDETRLYLTGLSMGGYGTWKFATKYPERFAAIAPVCGGGDPKVVCKIKHIPTWVFHGVKDQAVPIKKSEDMVSALQKCEGNVKFTIYPEAGHDSWTETYDNPLLYEWFLKCKK